MRVLLFFTVFILLLEYSCNTKKKLSPKLFQDDFLIKIIESARNGHVSIPKNTYYIESPIKIPSGTTINGNGSQIVLASSVNHALEINNAVDIKIDNLILKGRKIGYDFREFTHKIEKNLVRITNSESIELTRLNLSSHAFTAISVRNSSKININKVKISDIGIIAPKDLPRYLYSYDGIYFSTDSEKEINSIIISDCEFINISNTKSPYDFSKKHTYYGDGDGIHFQTKNPNGIKNVKILNCTFNSCISRGIKVQAGRNIEISNSQFKNCLSGIGITQETAVSEINIFSNSFDSCNIAIASNHDYPINNLRIIDNNFHHTNFTIRNSGKSSFTNATISNNRAFEINQCFIAGILVDCRIENNIITNYALNLDKSYYMAILLGSNSKNNVINNNSISTSVPTKSAIYIYPNVKHTTIVNNTFSLPETRTKDNYIIYSKSNDRRNRFEKNTIKLSKPKH